MTDAANEALAAELRQFDDERLNSDELPLAAVQALNAVVSSGYTLLRLSSASLVSGAGSGVLSVAALRNVLDACANRVAKRKASLDSVQIQLARADKLLEMAEQKVELLS
ncbi:hypothetical protein IW140_003283 [Coemansia sp. RSA 1813]|nr:hypothetical protein EV178_002902 [Coemansia sp. RSA 1646]KAJ1771693.1 hypothetical protein LPJ74_002120 [Coemansia sp. RSA 1843]KAJ2089671.1 hypothetical protein IW138_003269 [Coemansia sp. RSA 986]KAJ2569191.1 hypothetical protein IW140_003283 [Coemansia sp. RSA 1813]